jgi:hypothetical protein
MPPSSTDNSTSPTTALISGALAGIFSDGITYPISTAKTRLQVYGPQAIINSASFSADKPPSTWQTMKSIVKHEGIAKLYSGFTTIAMAAPARALYFAGYEFSKLEGGKLLNNPNHPLVHFCAGPIAQLSGSILWVPMDVVKERMQIQKSAAKAAPSGAANSVGAAGVHNTAYTGSLNAAQTILRTEGIRGLYRGYIAHQLVWGPFNSVYFMVYELAKSQYIELFHKGPANNLPVYIFPLCGSLAGAVAAAATAPIDLVKTRLQTQGNAKLYTGSIDCVRKIIAKDGMKALTNGIGARVLWLAPNVAITMSIYETIKKLFHVNPL